MVADDGAAGAGKRSRRELLIATGASAAFIAGCSKHSKRPKVHKIPSYSRNSDVGLLNYALDLEHQAIAAYTAGIPLLSGRIRTAAQHFFTLELDHAGEIAGLIKQAGGRFKKPPSGYNFGRPRTATDILNLLHRLEREQIAAYLQIIPSLSPGSVRAAVSTVLASDAQHLAVIRAGLGLPPTAAAVSGAE